MTGIAALLLTGGTTAHSRFGVPVPLLDDEPRSNIPLHSARAEVLRQAALIVVDEATMGQRELFELVDVLLRDIMRSVDEALADVPFGGKVLVLSGDFRQLAPVIRRAGRGQLQLKTLKMSELWQYFNVLKMTTNMRVQRLAKEDPVAAAVLDHFAAWLLDVGDGKLEDVCIPESMRVPFDEVMQLINHVFPNLDADPGVAKEACILSTLNKYVDELNAMVLALLHGVATTYLSADGFGPEAAELEQQYPVELLNSLTPSGLPPHKLLLKVGAPVVFIRNISRKNGMMNGTRAMVEN